MDDMFFADACQRSNRRIRMWYKEKLVDTLVAAKEKGAREIDPSIALAQKLTEALEEKVTKAADVPLRDVEVSQDVSLMKPVELEVTDILYKSKEKGSTVKYLRTRYKKSPEDKATSNWSYGWQQKQSRVPARDVNRGRCAILRDTFYRKNNVGPDPKYYSQPMGGEVSVCSESQCSA